MTKATAPPLTPLHQWPHTGDRVMLVKLVDRDGKSYEGFQWPESGPVKPAHCSTKADCESGGLFGWPWGLNLGGGKEPDYSGRWIVFSAPAAQVIDIDGDKSKVAAKKPADVDARVEYAGDWIGALNFTKAGREAWFRHRMEIAEQLAKQSKETHATGYSAASSATGYSAASSATGDCAASSATGDRAASSATGYSAASSATGDRAASSATGYSAASSATGYSAASSATGYRAASSATGDRAASSATGDMSIATTTGWDSTIEAGPTGIAATTAERVNWMAVPGALLLQRWTVDQKTKHVLFDADKLSPRVTNRERIVIDRGQILSREAVAP